MIEASPQEAERIRNRRGVARRLGVVVISAGLIAIAWWLVAPPPPAARPIAAPSPLERRLFERASGGDEIRAAGAQRLEGYGWIDRAAGVVHIPIDRAIDAVVVDPRLIGAGPRPGAAGGEVGR